MATTQSAEEQSWVEGFLRERRLNELQDHLFRQALRADGSIQRHAGEQGGWDWISVNGEAIGGPVDRQRSLDGVAVVEALERENPPLLRRETEHIYVLTPAGRGVARSRRRAGG